MARSASSACFRALDRAAAPMSPIVFQHSTWINRCLAGAASPTSADRHGSAGLVANSNDPVYPASRPSRRTSSCIARCPASAVSPARSRWTEIWIGRPTANPSSLPGVHRHRPAMTELNSGDDASSDARAITCRGLRHVTGYAAVTKIASGASQLLTVPSGGFRREIRTSDSGHAHHMIVGGPSLAVTSRRTSLAPAMPTLRSSWHPSEVRRWPGCRPAARSVRNVYEASRRAEMPGGEELFGSYADSPRSASQME